MVDVYFNVKDTFCPLRFFQLWQSDFWRWRRFFFTHLFCTQFFCVPCFWFFFVLTLCRRRLVESERLVSWPSGHFRQPVSDYHIDLTHYCDIFPSVYGAAYTTHRYWHFCPTFWSDSDAIFLILRNPSNLLPPSWITYFWFLF
jgi:hypothetical protein